MDGAYGLSHAVQRHAAAGIDGEDEQRAGRALKVLDADVLGTNLGAVLRAKIPNRKWFESMLAHGHSGAAEIGNRFTHLLGWGAISNMEQWVFDAAAKTYVFDESVRQRLEAANPEAARNIVLDGLIAGSNARTSDRHPMMQTWRGPPLTGGLSLSRAHWQGSRAVPARHRIGGGSPTQRNNASRAYERWGDAASASEGLHASRSHSQPKPTRSCSRRSRGW
jgi:hypothetical protein